MALVVQFTLWPSEYSSPPEGKREELLVAGGPCCDKIADITKPSEALPRMPCNLELHQRLSSSNLTTPQLAAV